MAIKADCRIKQKEVREAHRYFICSKRTLSVTNQINKYGTVIDENFLRKQAVRCNCTGYNFFQNMTQKEVTDDSLWWRAVRDARLSEHWWYRGYN